MRIESFWARGYRSLRDVRVDGLGAFNVFYGPNGGGKSNLLEALRTLFSLVAVVALEYDPPGAIADKRASEALKLGLIQRRDLCASDPSRVIVLGATIRDDIPAAPVLTSGGAAWPELTLEVTFDWTIQAEPKLCLSTLRSGDDDLRALWQPPTLDVPEHSQAGFEAISARLKQRDRVRALLVEELPRRVYGLVGADRQPQPEKVITALLQVEDVDVVSWHLREGRLKSALLAAQLSPSHEIRRKLAALRTLLAGEPLRRPPFDPVQDPRTGEVDLREPLPQGGDISIDLAGLGIAQIYAILAKAMLLGTRAVGLEEPEAHLHAPTSGRALRQLLVRLVEERHIDQLFIATHSNLFDLDPTGYFDVSLRDGCTVVERADLTRVDREHLYEPGPAKHALQRLLEYAPEDEVVFRRSNGTGITAQEMLRLLQEDDDAAVSFLQDIHGAAVRMVRVQAKKPQAK